MKNENRNDNLASILALALALKLRREYYEGEGSKQIKLWWKENNRNENVIEHYFCLFFNETQKRKTKWREFFYKI